MEASSLQQPSIQPDDQILRDPEDVILLTVIRCIGLLYGYYQLKLLLSLGSKYTLGVTTIFPVVASLIFNLLSYLLPEEFSQIPETLLYFILILDLPRACFLTSVALQRSECCKVGGCSSSILQGVKILAPWLSMDTVIECVVLILGYCSGIRRLEALCTFVCLSVLVNYVVMLTVFPLALRIVHEIRSLHKNRVVAKQERAYDVGGARSSSSLSPCSNLDSLLLKWGESSGGSSDQQYGGANGANLPTEVCQLIQPSSFWLRGKILAAVILALAYVFGWISISVDQLVVLSVAAALTIRYLFFDEKSESLRRVSEEYSVTTTTTTTVNTVYLDAGTSSGSSSSGTHHHHHQQAHQIISSSPSCNNTTAAVTAASTTDKSAGIAPAAAPHLLSSSLTTPACTTRVRKMPVNVNEVENLLVSRGELVERKNSGNDNYRELCCSSPDSGVSKSRPSSGAATPITFSIGDHSESDDEGEEDSGAEIKTETTGTQTMSEEKLRQVEDQHKEKEEGAADGGSWTGPPRPVEEVLALYRTDEGVKQLSDEEIINLVNAKHIPAYQLEKAVQDLERGVAIRRKLSNMQDEVLGPSPDIPYKNYDYSLVQGACCENVIGYIPVPVGIAGPLNMDGKQYYIPMATTEGCLVASTNRGCRALQNGVRTKVVSDGMSRAPVVRFPDSIRAAEAMLWLSESSSFEEVKQSFDASSRFARLTKVHPRIAGRYLFIRFVAKTGDAMGMNMISKGTEVALQTLQNHFPDMEILALSGNLCTDKKPAAVNWLEGRGKSVISEAIVPASIVENVLKTTTAALVELNIAKNLVGSAAAGSIGGFNAHAANIVTAMYIACGQDPAQNVASSNCMTIMEPSGTDGRDLFISCTMPSIECGTVGGGTVLPPQAACLEMLGVRGAHLTDPGENARTFARIVSAAVLAGELSLMSALAAGHLVRSHLKHNRSATLLSAITLEQQQQQQMATLGGAGGPPKSKACPKVVANGSSPSVSAMLKPVSALNGAGELIKRSLNSKSTPVINTMEFLSVPDCKQT